MFNAAIRVLGIGSLEFDNKTKPILALAFILFFIGYRF